MLQHLLAHSRDPDLYTGRPPREEDGHKPTATSFETFGRLVKLTRGRLPPGQPLVAYHNGIILINENATVEEALQVMARLKMFAFREIANGSTSLVPILSSCFALERYRFDYTLVLLFGPLPFSSSSQSPSSPSIALCHSIAFPPFFVIVSVPLIYILHRSD